VSDAPSEATLVRLAFLELEKVRLEGENERLRAALKRVLERIDELIAAEETADRERTE